MIAQLVENLVHLKCGEDGLDENRRADRSALDSERILGGVEDVIPQPRLEVTLHLGEIKIWTALSLLQLASVVEEVETEVKDTRRDRLAINQDMLLGQMPPARADQQDGDRRIETVGLSLRTAELDRFPDCVNQILLTLNDVLPRRRKGVLEVGHEDVCPGVEGVDHHLPLDRACDLHPALLQIGRSRCHLPFAVAYILCLGNKVGHLPGGEFFLPLAAPREELLARWIELPMEFCDEVQCVVAQNGVRCRKFFPGDLNALCQFVLALFHCSGGHAGDKVIERQSINDHHRHRAKDRGCHQRSPEIDITADHIHGDSPRERPVTHRTDECQSVNVFLE